MSNRSTTVESAQRICDLFVSHFPSSLLTHLIVIMFPSSLPRGVPGLSTIECDSRDVFRAITSLPARTASGLDGISSQMLKGTAEVTSSSLSTLFKLSLRKGVVPSEWKTSNVTPVYKAGDPKCVTNYHPISLLSLPSKLLERIVHSRLLSYILSNSILSTSQFGFRHLVQPRKQS